MPALPRATGMDHTLALLREGYGFVGSRCARYGSDAFEARLMLRPVVCMRGAEAAEFFYAADRFTRVRGMPPGIVRLLQDIGSTQQMEGANHRHRKALFLSLGRPAAALDLTHRAAREWRERIPGWQQAGRITLLDEVRAILTRAAAVWAGIPLKGTEGRRRTRELSEMVEATGSMGPRKLRALLLRSRAERWARGVIRAIRSGELPAPADSAATEIASYRDADGNRLDVATAAIELLNVLRPTIAVSHFIVFAARALHLNPDARERIAAGDHGYLEAFVEEIRRISPFFPFIGGRAREEVEWRGIRFPKGTWVLLDIYGTNLDPRIWPEPTAFRPERFLLRRPGPFEFIPQGGGEAALTHRCPGERLAIDLTKMATTLLATSMRYDVPEQDLSVDLARIPALPKSGFVISNVRPVA